MLKFGVPGIRRNALLDTQMAVVMLAAGGAAMWALVVLAILAAVWFAVVNAAFRKVVAVAVALAALAGFALYLASEREEKDRKAREHKIPHNMVALEDVRMVTEYGSTKLTGTVKNNSPFDIDYLTASLELFDCPTTETPVDRCLSIGKDDDIYLSVEVPAHSARSFDGFVTLTNVAPVKGVQKSIYNLATVRAAE